MLSAKLDGAIDSGRLEALLRGAVRRDAPTPVHVQIRNRLTEAIEQGVLGVGAQLPGELDLSRLTGVGRPTVRQALASLRRDGWITVQKGRGTFVAARRPRLSLLGFDGLTRVLSERGFEVEAETLSTRRADGYELEMLGDQLPGPVWVVERLRRLRDGTPLIHEEDAISLELFAAAPEMYEEWGSVGRILQDGYGHSIRESRVGSRAVPAGRRIGRLLAVAPSTPLLEMERLNIDPGGEKLNAVRFRLRTDLFPVVEEVVNPS